MSEMVPAKRTMRGPYTKALDQAMAENAPRPPVGANEEFYWQRVNSRATALMMEWGYWADKDGTLTGKAVREGYVE